MKKYLLLAFLFVVLIPSIVYAQQCDKNKVYISSITLKDKTESVTELDEVFINNNSINLNLSMAKEGDNIEYEIVVHNDSDENYEVDRNNLNTNSKYIDYSITSTDNSNIIKANSNKTFMIHINYNNKLSDSDFASGEYNENKEMVLSLINYNSNPNTSNNYIIILFVLILTIIITVIAIRNKKSTLIILVLLSGLSVIPINVFSECNYNFVINSKIILEGYDSFSVNDGPYYNINKDKYYETLDASVNKARNNQTIKVLENVSEEPTASIPAIKGLKLDLNGKTIDFQSTGSEYSIINDGELEMINSTDENSIMHLSTKFMNNKLLTINENTELYSDNLVVENAGDLYVQGGFVSGDDGPSIVNTGTVYMSSGSVGAYSRGIENHNKAIITGGHVGGNTAIFNEGEESFLRVGGEAEIFGSRNAISNQGTVIVDSGTIKSPECGIRNFGNATVNNAEINVEGPSDLYGIYNNNDAILDFISGSIFVRSGLHDAFGIYNKGIVTFTDGKVLVTSHGDNAGILSEGTTTILSGEIIGRNIGIDIAGGILTLGKDDNNVDSLSPVISGDCDVSQGPGYSEIGIYNRNGIFNYYDGIVKVAVPYQEPNSTINCIRGEITNTPNSYIVKRKVSNQIAEAYLETE